MVFWHERALAMAELWPRYFPLYGLQSTYAYCRMMALVIGCFACEKFVCLPTLAVFCQAWR